MIPCIHFEFPTKLAVPSLYSVNFMEKGEVYLSDLNPDRALVTCSIYMFAGAFFCFETFGLSHL